MRWIMVALLLLSAAPALAQLEKDSENTAPVLPDPPPALQHVIPPSQVNADRAVVVASRGTARRKVAWKSCSNLNPCATPTPESR